MPLLCATAAMNFATRPPEPSFFPLAQHAGLRPWHFFLHVVVRNVFAWDAGFLLWIQEVPSR